MREGREGRTCTLQTGLSLITLAATPVLFMSVVQYRVLPRNASAERGSSALPCSRCVGLVVDDVNVDPP